MVKIWLNHWFSTAYNIIGLIKEGVDGSYVVGSNENDHSPLEALCDEWYQEPVLGEEEYVDYCLDFCREHRIDVFIPRRELVGISRRKSDFERNGTKVMVDDHSLVCP